MPILYKITLSALLASDSSGIILDDTKKNVGIAQEIEHFVRTPNGRGLLAVGSAGEVAVWEKQQLGKLQKGEQSTTALLGKGHWQATKPTRSAIFAKGRAIVFYTKEDNSLSLQHLDHGQTTPSDPVPLPLFAPNDGDELSMLMAVSDIDDGHSQKGRRTQQALIMAVAGSGEAWVWRIVSKQAEDNNALGDQPDIILISHSRLPVELADNCAKPHLILPVDPMGWHQSVVDWTTNTPAQDMVLSVTQDGVLEFWRPKLGLTVQSKGNKDGADVAWTRSGIVRTGKKNILRARCSSRKKTVLGKSCCSPADGQYARRMAFTR
jgi:hypothetical protein